MLRRLTLILLLAAAPLAWAEESKPRVIVLTDISNEPDDEESLVRFLVYANEFDVEGLVATTSTWLRKDPREDLIRRHLAAYAEVRPNLVKHAGGFPTMEQLAALTCTGQPGYGLDAIGAGRTTAGSQRILAALARPDPRPLWVLIWGGSNTLAQALSDLRSAHPEQVPAAVAKLRVYAIGDQDNTGAWLRREFPGLFYIVSPSTQDEKESHHATWSGISGDRLYKNGPMHHFDLVDNPWLETNIIQNHGALGALYPKLAYIMEGDTPSFLGLINHGLGGMEQPSYGGWGGRYVLYRAHGETHPIWTNNSLSRDTVTAADGRSYTSDMATIWRWREHFQNDFAARMDWCVAATFAQANHNPIVVANGDQSREVITLPASFGREVSLSARGTTDPDGNQVKLTWWIYPEAGTLTGATLLASEGATTAVKLPGTGKAGTVHVILQAEDNGTPHLFAYRRIILTVNSAQ